MMNIRSRNCITIVIVLVVAVALGLWVHSRWNAWFHSVPEVDFSFSKVPDRVTLTPGEDFVTQRTVSWRCGNAVDESSFLTLVHNDDTVTVKADGNVVNSRGAVDAFYAARLTKLLPGETYRYRVQTGKAASQWYTMKMSERYPKTRRFVYFGDVQDTIGGFAKSMFTKLNEKYGDYDFWACAGDLIDAPVNAHWNYLYECTDSTLAKVPFINTVGNHDYIKTLYPHIDPRWTKTFVYPDNGAKTAKGKSYYIDFPEMRVMVLDTHGIFDCVTIASEYKWLREALRGAGDRWKVVLMHHPVYSVRKGHNNYAIRNAFKPLIEKYGVHLVLQGHEHGYSRYISQEGATKGNHPVYIVSFASPKNYKAKNHVDNMKIIPDEKMYQTVVIEGEKMKFSAFDEETDKLVDEVVINKH